MRILESFHVFTNLFQKTKIALFYRTEGVCVWTLLQSVPATNTTKLFSLSNQVLVQRNATIFFTGCTTQLLPTRSQQHFELSTLCVDILNKHEHKDDIINMKSVSTRRVPRVLQSNNIPSNRKRMWYFQQFWQKYFTNRSLVWHTLNLPSATYHI
jgi:hypothetical protein